MFKYNVGGLDCFLRLFFGTALLALIFIGPKTLWGMVGLVSLLTGLFRTCPLYSLLGINTSRGGPYS